MDDYVEDYKYNNCFWKKSGVLYTHAKSKFFEYMSIGTILQKIAKEINNLCNTLDNVHDLYQPAKDRNCTRSKGILVFFDCIKILNDELLLLSNNIDNIASKILEKKYSYESKRLAAKMCDECYKSYQNELDKLNQKKDSYFDTINKSIEYFLIQKAHNRLQNNKIKTELENRLNIINNKKLEYKKQIEEVEKSRVEYMEFQGNIFASEEELEKECTDELRLYFKKFIQFLSNFLKNFNLPEEKIDIIERIKGELDNKIFAEKNKSLMTGPKRNLYREYCLDMNYYADQFEIVKSKLKGKNEKEMREINNAINTEINDFLKDIITEEPDQIHLRIEQIARDIKDNKLSENDYKYLENKFKQKYEEFLKWKEEKVLDQDYRKVGKEWDDRFCYMYTFLRYFNKKRVETKELNKKNYDYLCNAMKLILQLNENEDVDYNLCDLIVILSSTFFMGDLNNKNGRKYVNEEIRKCPIMQKKRFWVGLTKYELNEEIQKTNKIEETLSEEEINESKLNNSVVAKLMSISFNIIQFVMDSKLFNGVIYDIFKYCKINEENRILIVQMMENQLQCDDYSHLKLDKELLLTPPKDILEEEEEKIENKKEINNDNNKNDNV